MEVNPLSIIFVKSDSKGDRLLFIYPYVTDNKSENERQKFLRRNPFALSIIEDLLQTPLPHTSNSYKGQLTGFTDEVLSTLFAVKPELCNRKFELKVNDVRFVGHPTLLPFQANKDEGTSSMILINVVFALQASASHSIVKCYYDLSKRLGKALRHEEKRCAYLSDEMKIMISAHDEMSALDSDSEAESADETRPTSSPSANTDIPPHPKSPFDLILQRSSLSRSMKTVYEDLSKTGLVQVRINRWVLVSFCLPHKAHQMHNTGLLIEPETIDKCLQKLRPYHGILLMVDPNELLESMPLDGSPALLRLIKLYSPLKSLQTIAIEADLTLSQVFQLTGHLVYWAKATVIYPLCESNVYVIAPGAQLCYDTQLVEAFAKEFPGLCLLQVVSEFSLPAPLWYHARMGAGGAARLARVAAWLLRRRLALQLHTYVQFRLSRARPNAAHSRAEEYYCEKHSAYTTRPSGSMTSLNVLTPNINVEVETMSLNANDLEDSYPTENNLNQTNFSHTKPIVIESDTRTVLTAKEGDASSIDTDSANHSLESSEDAKDQYNDTIDITDHKNEITVSSTSSKENIAVKTPSDQKKLNGSSVDSGYSNILNGPNSKENGDTIRVMDVNRKSKNIIRKMELTLNGKQFSLDTVPSSMGSDLSDRFEGPINTAIVRNESHYGTEKIVGGNISTGSCNNVEKKTIERTISSNLKLDMSFQPPTVISSISTQTSCGAESSEAAPNVRSPSSIQPGTEQTLLQDFTEDEKATIFDIPAAHNPEDLALMAHLHKKGYFRGEQHLEEIMFMENLTRSQVLQLLDKFRAVLVTYETEDPAIAMLYAS